MLIAALITPDNDEFLEQTWDDMRTLSWECARSGRTAELLELLSQSGLTPRVRPLREALAAIASGNARFLNAVTPEVREPACSIVEMLTSETRPMDRE